jgi:hypothetical protein
MGTLTKKRTAAHESLQLGLGTSQRMAWTSGHSILDKPVELSCIRRNRHGHDRWLIRQSAHLVAVMPLCERDTPALAPAQLILVSRCQAALWPHRLAPTSTGLKGPRSSARHIWLVSEAYLIIATPRRFKTPGTYKEDGQKPCHKYRGPKR